jgi:hypothetical protein
MDNEKHIDNLYLSKGAHDPKLKEVFKKPQTANTSQQVPIVAPVHSYQCDILFFDSLARANHGYKMLLNIISLDNRFLWSFPLKKKSEAKDVMIDWIEKMSGVGHHPSNIYTDAGSEFTNKALRDYLSQQGIRSIDTTEKNKTGVVERVNGTLRSLIDRYMEKYKTVDYIDALPEIVDQYNHTPNDYFKILKDSKGHARLIAPAEATLEDVIAARAILRLKGKNIEKGVGATYTPGSYVRIREKKALFTKGSKRNYSSEVYKVIEYKPPVTIVVANAADSEKTRQFNWYDLQIVSSAASADKRSDKYKAEVAGLKKEAKFKRLMRDTKLPLNETGNIVIPKRLQVRGPRVVKAPKRLDL